MDCCYRLSRLIKFMPENRKFIFVCTGSDCKDNGCRGLLNEIKDLSKKDPYKGQYRIVKTKCMDFCKTGPVVVIKDEVIKKANLEKVREGLGK